MAFDSRVPCVALTTLTREAGQSGKLERVLLLTSSCVAASFAAYLLEQS